MFNLYVFHSLFLIVLIITLLNNVSMKSILNIKPKTEFIKTKKDLIKTLSRWPTTIHRKLELHNKNSNFNDISKVFNLCAKNKDAIPILIENSDFIFSQSTYCYKQTNLWILIAVHTHPNHRQKRDLIRGTWGSLRRVNNRKIGILFFMGLSNDLKEQKLIEEEERIYGDVVQRAFLENYYNMTRKHITIMEWISQGYCNNVPFLVKVDDDTFVDIFHLTRYLELKHNDLKGLFYCTATSNIKVVRPNSIKHSKWEISDKEYPEKIFPTYCEGFGYIMDMKLAPYLYWCSMFQPPIWIDDVYVTGILAQNLGIPRLRFQDGHSYLNLKPAKEEGLLADCIFLVSFYNEFYPLTVQEMWREVVAHSMGID
uniref:Hexosyltransferase n=2 Tax=Schistosoma mansoni TaxID=6183 RepID=A0A3Q0KJU7_SCHMA